MAKRKLLTYVLMISRYFPATHPRRGEETHFMSGILLNFDRVVFQDEDESQRPGKIGYGSKYAAAMIKEGGFAPKLHTIRENYDLWARRAEKINAGEAVLSIRQWSGKPYRSKQVEFLRLEKIGVQKIKISNLKPPPWQREEIINKLCVVDKIRSISPYAVAQNDGLSYDDFCAWFKKDMKGCVIHFTENFRY